MKLYIGNLSYDTTETELREFLDQYGPIVDLHMPTDRDTGRPRGFVFVTLSSREIGEAAIAQLDGAEFGGRNLRVREAEDRRSEGSGSKYRSPRGGGEGGGGGNRGDGGGYRSGGGGGGYRGGGGRHREDRGDYEDRGGRSDRGDRNDRGDRGGREDRGNRKRYRSI